LAIGRKHTDRVRILVFHGYLLRGTGSNVYNASLVAALARLGHEVHLLCQDREPPPLPDGVTVHVPDIGGLLPVYVLDEYDGFRVKAFPELTDAELAAYIEANVSAVRDVVDAAGGVDAALAGHLVMGPAILARAGLGSGDGGPGYAVKIHGSALEYTVKPHPDRFLPYAHEGIEAASCVLVGSRHTAESLWAALDQPGLKERTRLGPPGVDTDLFAPLGPEAAAPRLRELAGALAGEAGRDDSAGEEPRRAAWGRSPAQAAEAVGEFAEGTPRVVFVGKLIVSKGIDLLLAAWPLVAAANPGARLLVVGFGEYAQTSERLWAAIARGDLDDLREITTRGRALEGGPPSRLEMLETFLDDTPAGYREAASAAAGSVAFAGRLEHDEVGLLAPAADALVFPSTFPEAFGMVAAEAAAAGALPVSAHHSGLAEVSRELAAALPPAARELVSFELGPGAVEAIASRVNAWLALDEPTRSEASRALRRTVERLWSWEGVARGVLAAAAGDLDSLPPIPRA
jgi:glycosyltransferase involved in cell wall biosynthesis